MSEYKFEKLSSSWWIRQTFSWYTKHFDQETIVNDIFIQGQPMPECKVWRNPLNLFRGAEYSRFQKATKKEPLTYYDMNLSAQVLDTIYS